MTKLAADATSAVAGRPMAAWVVDDADGNDNTKGNEDAKGDDNAKGNDNAKGDG